MKLEGREKGQQTKENGLRRRSSDGIRQEGEQRRNRKDERDELADASEEKGQEGEKGEKKDEKDEEQEEVLHFNLAEARLPPSPSFATYRIRCTFSHLMHATIYFPSSFTVRSVLS